MFSNRRSIHRSARKFLPMLLTPLVLASLALAPLMLGGCNEGGGIIIGPTTPPTSIATSINFSDKMPGDAIGGSILVTRAANDSDATAYMLRWGSHGVPAPTTDAFPTNFIGRFVISGARTDTPYNLDIYVAAPPAELAIDSIMVFTSNSAGENVNGISVPLINVTEISNVPSLHPASVSFADSDNRVSIGGTVSFEPPVDETGISSYVIRLAGENGCPLQGAALGEVAQGSSYSFAVTPRAVWSASRSIAVIAKNSFGEANSNNCVGYTHSDPAEFNDIVPGAKPFYMARRATSAAPVDDDDTVAYHATVSIQGSADERDLDTGYFVNLGDNAGNCVKPALAQLAPIGNSQWQDVEINLAEVPATATKLLVSTGTECGFTGGAPHVLSLNNQLGNWFLIKSTTGNRCLQTMETEPSEVPDNDGQSNELRLATCDSHNPAQHFFANNIYAGDDPASNTFFNVVSETTGGCLWRRDSGNQNTGDQQEWQVRKDCSASELGNEIQIIARSSANGYRNKTLSVRSTVETNKQYSCAIASGDRLVSTWDNCSSSPSLFNFAPAGTTNSNQYAVFADGP